MKTVITALFILSMFRSSAQEIGGKILDDKKEPMINANVQAFQNGILKGSNVTDFDGDYVIKPLDSGLYDVKIFYTGFDTILVMNVVVTQGNRTTQNCSLRKVNGAALCVNIAYKRPLVSHDRPEPILEKDEPGKICCGWIDPSNVIENTNHYNTERGAKVNLPVDTDTIYIIDGIAVRAPAGVAIINDWFKIEEPDHTSHILKKAEIEYMPASTIDDLMTIFPGIYQQRRGDPISIRGNSGIAYYIDGVRQ